MDIPTVLTSVPSEDSECARSARDGPPAARTGGVRSDRALGLRRLLHGLEELLVACRALEPLEGRRPRGMLWLDQDHVQEVGTGRCEETAACVLVRIGHIVVVPSLTCCPPRRPSDPVSSASLPTERFGVQPRDTWAGAGRSSVHAQVPVGCNALFGGTGPLASVAYVAQSASPAAARTCCLSAAPRRNPWRSSASIHGRTS